MEELLFHLGIGTVARISNLSLLISVYQTTPDVLARKEQPETRPIRHSGPFFDHRTLMYPRVLARVSLQFSIFSHSVRHLSGLTLALLALLLEGC